MIPKRTFQVWLGNSQPSKLLKACRKSLLTLHPDYEHLLVTDNSIFEHEKLKQHKPTLLRLWDEFDSCKRPIPYKSDLLKVCYPYVCGGIALDYDLYFVQSLNSINDKPFVLAKVTSKPLLVSEAVIGALEGSAELFRVLKWLEVDRIEANRSWTIGFSRLSRDLRWNPLAEEYFVPHGRTSPENDKYKYTKKTIAIHCWSEKIYDEKELARISCSISDPTSK